MDRRIIEGAERLLSAERGRTYNKDAPLRMALVYPSPYTAAMSSLGFLSIHRRANARAETICERAVLPTREELLIHKETRTPLCTLETRRPVSEFDLIGISHAYELELTGVVEVLELSGLEPRAKDRRPSDPLVVIGGPITFSNPLPTAPFADVMILGEAEGALEALLSRMEQHMPRKQLLEELAALPGFFVPAIHGEELPPIAQAEDADLPAYSELWTPNTELHDMVLVEPERGCHRGCTFCVMRRSTNGGMRLVSPDRVLEVVNKEAPRVGLVGAAVTDHPRIKEIVRGLIERGQRVGISSLRADRLDEEFVSLLAEGGYRSMTVALDATSVRLRDEIEKNLKDRHVERAAVLAKAAGMKHLKVYVIVGLPGETNADLDELIAFVLRLRKTLPVVLGVSPFVPKFHTPLADAPFAGESRSQETLTYLKKKLMGKAELRGPGAREAYVEYRLAQGGFRHAEAAIAAAHAGGSLSAWKRALADVPERVRPANFARDLVPAATLRRRSPEHRPTISTPAAEF